MEAKIKDVHNIRYRYLSVLNKLKKGIIVRKKGFKINPVNLKYVLDYIDNREKYLQNINGYSEVAKIRYSKTLNKELAYCKNILVWLNDIDIKKISKERIKKLYEGIETGKITGLNNKPIADSTKEDYYRMFKGGLFAFLGINKYAKEIILRKFRDDQEVEFFRIETFIQIVKKAKLRSHKLLLWLMFDTGIEIGAILQLKKVHFTKSSNGDTYIVHVPNSISKKVRSKRDIFVLHPETNELLEASLEEKQDNDFIFGFMVKNVERIVRDIVIKYGYKTEPGNKRITPKHFRSSCACYLLLRGWSTDKIKYRLGHKPSSSVIDRYVNYLAINQEEDIKESKVLDLENYRELYRNIQNQNVKLQEELKSTRESNARQLKSFKRILEIMATKLNDDNLKQKLQKVI